MRLSVARAQAGAGHEPTHGEHGAGSFGAASRRMALALSVVLVLGAIGLLFSPAKAGAGTAVFAPTQVFASVGGSTVNDYIPGTPNTTPPVPTTLDASLNDGSTIPPTSPVYPGYPAADNTAGSAFDASGNFYVTDDYSGQISEYNPDGSLKGVFASGLQNPLSLVFDNSGNLYVGQQNTPYIAELNSSGQSIANIGPVQTGETGDDWIDLASDQCTFYYTTETNVIYRFSNCAGSVGQQANFNSVPFPGARAFQVRILPQTDGGGALVADTNSVLRLDSNGNVIQAYPCSAADQSSLEAAYPSALVEAPLPDCGGSALQPGHRPERHLLLGRRLVLGQHLADRPGLGPGHERGQHGSRLPLRPDGGERCRSGRIAASRRHAHGTDPTGRSWVGQLLDTHSRHGDADQPGHRVARR